MITRHVEAGGWYSFALPDGSWGSLIPETHITTSEGVVDLPNVINQPPENVLFIDGYRGRDGKLWITGQGHRSGVAWLWNGLKWEPVGSTFGTMPCKFADGFLYVVVSGSRYMRLKLDSTEPPAFVDQQIGVQGIRQVVDGQVISGDATTRNTDATLHEFTVHGDVVVGQGHESGTLVNGRELEPGDCRHIRFEWAPNLMSVAIVKQPEKRAIMCWFERRDVETLPIQAPRPTPVPVPVPIPIPIPEPIPVPTHFPPFDFASCHYVGGSPDVSRWAQVTSITQLNVTPAGVGVQFDARARWPEFVNPDVGDTQFTLWIAMCVNEQWFATGAMRFWRGKPVDGGDITRDNQIGGNWTYFAPPLNRQPVAGEPVVWFVTQGDCRRIDHHSEGFAERSNAVQIPFPAAGEFKNYLFGDDPIPVPNPPPVPQPPAPPIILPTDLSPVIARLDHLGAQIEELFAAQAAAAVMLADIQRALAARPGTVTFPAYNGKVLGQKIRLTPE